MACNWCRASNYIENRTAKKTPQNYVIHFAWICRVISYLNNVVIKCCRRRRWIRYNQWPNVRYVQHDRRSKAANKKLNNPEPIRTDYQLNDLVCCIYVFEASKPLIITHEHTQCVLRTSGAELRYFCMRWTSYLKREKKTISNMLHHNLATKPNGAPSISHWRHHSPLAGERQ